MLLSVNVMVKQVPSPGSVSMEISPFLLSTSCLIRKSPVPRFVPLDETPFHRSCRSDPDGSRARWSLTGDDIAARVTVDPECDLRISGLPAESSSMAFSEKISDDRDIVFDRKKEILFQTAAVRGDGEQGCRAPRHASFFRSQGRRSLIRADSPQSGGSTG